jgi:chaperonin GroES
MATTNIQPTRDMVLVKKIDYDEIKSRSGLILPEEDKKRMPEGTVVAVGPGALNSEGNTIPMRINVDDRVIFSNRAGLNVTDDEGEDFLLMHESDILATIGTAAVTA